VFGDSFHQKMRQFRNDGDRQAVRLGERRAQVHERDVLIARIVALVDNRGDK
jgi:hypothetical protein